MKRHIIEMQARCVRRAIQAIEVKRIPQQIPGEEISVE
jgi:hypothetical protein